MHSTSPRSNIHQKSLIKDKSSFCLTSKDISYVLTAREMQGHKMRLGVDNGCLGRNDNELDGGHDLSYPNETESIVQCGGAVRVYEFR